LSTRPRITLAPASSEFRSWSLRFRQFPNFVFPSWHLDSLRDSCICISPLIDANPDGCSLVIFPWIPGSFPQDLNAPAFLKSVVFQY
jgi:hypothetical protein